MTLKTLPVIFAISFTTFSLFGQGAVYTKTADVPRLQKNPKPVTLKSMSGNARILKVRGSLGEERKDQSSSRGGAGMTGRLTTMRKFARVEISGVNALTKPASVEVVMEINENDKLGTLTQTVKVNQQANNYVIDTKGFDDVFGSEIKTKKSGSTTTSTKYKYSEAAVESMSVVIKDDKGNPLFSGGWPDAPTIQVTPPAYLKPREFTSTDGRKINALVAAVESGTATMIINGKTYQIPISKFVDADKKFLSEWKK